MSTQATIGITDAKTNFSKLTANVNKTGIPVTVFKNNSPWVEIKPLAYEKDSIPKETQKAMDEANCMLADKSAKRYQDANQLFADLGI